MANNFNIGKVYRISVLCKFAIIVALLTIAYISKAQTINNSSLVIKNPLTKFQLDSIKEVSNKNREQSLRNSASRGEDNSVIKNEQGEIIATSWGSVLPTIPYIPVSDENLAIAKESLRDASNANPEDILQRPEPPRLVNDYSGILTTVQSNSLEIRCTEFANQTSNQVAIVILPTLFNYEKGDLAYKIGNKWGVGQKEFNNGVVILIKPKIEQEKGEVYIAVGNGLEPVLTDAITNRIVELRLIPAFKENDYYNGINDALNLIFPIASGEISTDEFAPKDSAEVGVALFFVIFIFALIFIILLSKKDNNNNMGSGNRRDRHLENAIIFGNILSGLSRGGFGSSGGFRGGGFGGGGFGGFGGGGFSGGGAGGSW